MILIAWHAIYLLLIVLPALIQIICKAILVKFHVIMVSILLQLQYINVWHAILIVLHVIIQQIIAHFVLLQTIYKIMFAKPHVVVDTFLLKYQ